MPEKVDRDGKKFWKFPELPFDVGEKTRALYNYYMRTNPETGELVADQWAVYPNNSTPATLGPLMRMLREITDLNAAKLATMPGFDDQGRMKDEHAYWNARLEFYESKVAELAEIDPNQSVGMKGNAVSDELALYVVEPLFLGWYPTTVPPFNTQPGVFSQDPQKAQAVMDLYVPFSLANQIAITRASLDDAYAKFKEDLKENAKRFFTENIPVLPALNVLPFVLVGAAGLAVYGLIKD